MSLMNAMGSAEWMYRGGLRGIFEKVWENRNELFNKIIPEIQKIQKQISDDIANAYLDSVREEAEEHPWYALHRSLADHIKELRENCAIPVTIEHHNAPIAIYKDGSDKEIDVEKTIEVVHNESLEEYDECMLSFEGSDDQEGEQQRTEEVHQYLEHLRNPHVETEDERREWAHECEAMVRGGFASFATSMAVTQKCLKIFYEKLPTLHFEVESLPTTLEVNKNYELKPKQSDPHFMVSLQSVESEVDPIEIPATKDNGRFTFSIPEQVAGHRCYLIVEAVVGGRTADSGDHRVSQQHVPARVQIVEIIDTVWIEQIQHYPQANTNYQINGMHLLLESDTTLVDNSLFHRRKSWVFRVNVDFDTVAIGVQSKDKTIENTFNSSEGKFFKVTQPIDRITIVCNDQELSLQVEHRSYLNNWIGPGLFYHPIREIELRGVLLPEHVWQNHKHEGIAAFADLIATDEQATTSFRVPAQPLQKIRCSGKIQRNTGNGEQEFSLPAVEITGEKHEVSVNWYNLKKVELKELGHDADESCVQNQDLLTVDIEVMEEDTIVETHNVFILYSENESREWFEHPLQAPADFLKTPFLFSQPNSAAVVDSVFEQKIYVERNAHDGVFRPTQTMTLLREFWEHNQELNEEQRSFEDYTICAYTEKTGFMDPVIDISAEHSHILLFAFLSIDKVRDGKPGDRMVIPLGKYDTVVSCPQYAAKSETPMKKIAIPAVQYIRDEHKENHEHLPALVCRGALQSCVFARWHNYKDVKTWEEIAKQKKLGKGVIHLCTIPQHAQGSTLTAYSDDPYIPLRIIRTKNIMSPKPINSVLINGSQVFFQPSKQVDLQLSMRHLSKLGALTIGKTNLTITVDGVDFDLEFEIHEESSRIEAKVSGWAGDGTHEAPLQIDPGSTNILFRVDGLGDGAELKWKVNEGERKAVKVINGFFRIESDQLNTEFQSGGGQIVWYYENKVISTTYCEMVGGSQTMMQLDERAVKKNEEWIIAASETHEGVKESWGSNSDARMIKGVDNGRTTFHFPKGRSIEHFDEREQPHVEFTINPFEVKEGVDPVASFSYVKTNPTPTRAQFGLRVGSMEYVKVFEKLAQFSIMKLHLETCRTITKSRKKAHLIVTDREEGIKQAHIELILNGDH